MKPTDVKAALMFAISNKLPILLKGAPGIGKSDIVAQAAKDSNAKLIISHPVVSDPTDYKGLPFPSENGREAVFLPFGELNELINTKDTTVFFLDDLGQAPASVQAACMQLILARRINGHKVSDKVVFFAATNRREDRAGVTGILEPVKSRFSAIIELTPDIDDWVSWANQNNMPMMLVSFIQFKPDFLYKWKPTADMTNSPCPRTVASVGKMVNCNIPEKLEFEMFSGAAGQGFAAEFNAYRKVYMSLPKIEEIMDNAESMAIPTDPAKMFAISGYIAHNNTAKNIPKLYKYIVRMPLEFQTLVMKSTAKIAKNINSKVTSTNEFLDWSVKNSAVIF